MKVVPTAYKVVYKGYKSCINVYKILAMTSLQMFSV